MPGTISSIEVRTQSKWPKLDCLGNPCLYIFFFFVDLAARNVLLDSNLEVKVADFGLSRLIAAEEDWGRTQTRVGPLRWFSPECFQLVYSEKSDVWAFGATLFEIATGHMPFPNITNDNLISLVPIIRDQGCSPISPGTGGPELLNQRPGGLPGWMEETMKMCFKVNPKDRPTLEELVKFIEINAPPEVVLAENRREAARADRAKLVAHMNEIIGLV